MSILKWAVLTAWAFGIVCFFDGRDTLLFTLGRASVVVMVVVHFVECFVFAKELRRAPGVFSEHLWLVFLFGFVHVREVRAAVTAAADEA